MVLVAALVVLYFGPGVVRTFHLHGMLSEHVMAPGWWIAGGLVALAALPDRWFGPGARAVKGMIVAVPVLSVIGHLAATHWIYEQPFRMHAVAPLLLGLGVVWAHRFGPECPAWLYRQGIVLTCAAATAACLISPMLHYDCGYGLTPMRGTLAASAVLMGYGWWRRGGVVLLANAVLAGVATGLGDTPTLMHERVAAGWRFATAVLDANVPRTMLAWGVLVFGLAFVWLWIGVVMSVARRRVAFGVE